MSDIRLEFRYHPLNQGGVDACTKVRRAFTALLDEIEAVVPASRERSVAITKLQEACNWAVRGVATQKENQL